MKKVSIRYVILFLLVAIQGAIIGMAIKAAIGISAWDALNQSLAQLNNIKVGTMIIIVNGILILFQLIILKKDFNYKHLLQFAVSIVLGYFINFSLYEIYTFTISSYLVSLLLFIVATCMSAILLGIILNMKLISFPAEGFCSAIAVTKKLNFVKVRMGLDIFSVIMSILITLFFKTPLVIREGTVIGTLLFSPLMGMSMKKSLPYMKQLNLID